jgi:hypothetical protein
MKLLKLSILWPFLIFPALIYSSNIEEEKIENENSFIENGNENQGYENYYVDEIGVPSYNLDVNGILERGVLNQEVVNFLKNLWNLDNFSLFDTSLNELFIGQLRVDEEFLEFFKSVLSFRDSSDYVMSILNSIHSNNFWKAVYEFEAFIPRVDIFEHFSLNYQIKIEELIAYLKRMKYFRRKLKFKQSYKFIQNWKNDL